jgi:hypothetical protein
MLNIKGTITGIDDYTTYAYAKIEGYEKGNENLIEFTVIVPKCFLEQVNLLVNKKVELECGVMTGFNGKYVMGVIESIKEEDIKELENK